MPARAQTAPTSSPLARARRVVVKVGSALLVDAATGRLNRSWLETLVEDVVRLRRQGKEIVLVSSGAIALGRRHLGLPKGPLQLEESQAAAAVGQIPVINENDTVATSEIRYGDNDRLAARVASMMSADCLVLLSDIDGLYTAPPSQKGASFLPVVEEITPEIEAMAGKPVSGVGSGGMITKIEAGKIALGAGCNMVIASGHEMHPLRRVLDGARCTWFIANASALQSRKRWIAGTLQPIGHLVVDEGAAAALAKGKSLLPAGVKRLEGSFTRGDTVSIITTEGREIARGLIAYDAGDAARILGLKSSEIEKVLGFRGRDVLIHRDDMVLMGSECT